MKQGEATYTVTISGPGFTLSADSNSVTDPRDWSREAMLSWALYHAFLMLRAHVKSASAVAAELAMGTLEFDDPCPTPEIDAAEALVHDAAIELRKAWDRHAEAVQARCAELLKGPPSGTSIKDAERKERMGGEGNERSREQHGIETKRIVRYWDKAQ